MSDALAPGGGFSARLERDAVLGAVAVLAWDGGRERSRSLEARIVPGFGANLARFSAGGRAIIDYDPALLAAHDFTGTPVLYPTPNRVRDARFSWKDRVYRQVKARTAVLEHGLVHSEAWEHGAPVADGDAARFACWIDFGPGSPVFEAFPFPHRLALSFTLSRGGITVAYEIANRGRQEVPFGFGLHPYFIKLAGEDGTFVSLPASGVMEATPDLLPTGRVLPVAGTALDLRTPVPVGSLDLDHVFTDVAEGRSARVEHRSLGLAIDLEATTDFTHLVLYTPRGQRFFCLEHQTCSTDAHNLFARGFAAASGLKTVAPDAVHRGSVAYTLRWATGST